MGEKLPQLGTTKERFSAFREDLVSRVLEQGRFVLKPVYYSQIAPSMRSAPMGRKKRPIHPVLERLALRRFFLHDQKLLAELSRCGWHALRSFLKAAVPESAGLPGAVIAVQTFGDFPERFRPRCHLLCTDGCFYDRGGFRLAPKFHLRDLSRSSGLKVLRMLLARGKINRELIRMMEGWRHSGFNVYAGPRIHPW